MTHSTIKIALAVIAVTAITSGVAELLLDQRRELRALQDAAKIRERMCTTVRSELTAAAAVLVSEESVTRKRVVALRVRDTASRPDLIRLCDGAPGVIDDVGVETCAERDDFACLANAARALTLELPAAAQD